MQRKHARAFTTGASLLLTVSTPAIVHAQTTSYTSPRALIDANGVDLSTGEYTVAAASISVGGENGLAWRQGRDDLWGTSITKKTNVSTGKTEFLVVVGAARNVFVQNGTTYTAKEQDGATLTYGAETYTYHTPSGEAVTFFKTNTTTIVDSSAREAIPIDITETNGRKITFNYGKATIKVEGSAGYTNKTYWRIQSLSTLNYQIHAAYAADTMTDVLGLGYWLSLKQLMAIDTSVDACAVTAGSCATTKTWPKIDFSTGAMTDALGRVTTSTGTAIRYPGSTSDDITIAKSGTRVTSVTAAGVTTAYSIVDSGTTRTTTATTGTLPSRVWTFDIPTGRILSEQWREDAGGPVRTRAYEYDPTSLLLTKVTQPEGDYVKYTYDTLGRFSEERRVSKTPGTPADRVTTYGYQYASCTADVTVICRSPQTITDPNLNTTTYAYNGTHGGVETVTSPADSDGISAQTRYTYTQLGANGQVSTSGLWMLTGVSTCVTGANCVGTANELKTTIAYGSGLSVSSVTKAAGNGSLSATTSYGYDAIGNLTAVDGPLAGTADTTNYTYDAIRRRTMEISPDPDGTGTLKRRATFVTFLPGGQIDTTTVGTVDASGANFVGSIQAVYGYDANHRQSRQAVVVNGTTYSVTQYAYDSLGQLQCTALRMDSAQWNGQTDACVAQVSGSLGPDRVSKVIRDGLGRPTSLFSGLGSAAQAEEKLSYTPSGQVKTATDANGNVTTYGYDGFDQRSSVTYPDGSADKYQYDSNGNLTVGTLRDNQVINLAYDKLNHLIQRDTPNTAYWEVDRTYRYNNAGQLIRAADSNGRILTFSYDAFGRKTAQTDNWYGTGNEAFQYDLAGNRTRLTWWDNNAISYDYLTTGEMSAIRDGAGNVLASFAYDNLGNRTSLSRANGTATSYNYDSAARLQGLVLSFIGNASYQSIVFGYNPAGQIISRQSYNDAYAWTGYYNVNRAYGVNGLNQLTAAGSTALGYDKRGNLTNSGSDTYTYTAENNLASGGGTGLAYDPLGRLFNGVIDSGVNTTFVYDGPDLLAESDQNTGAVLRRYVYGPGSDEPLIWYEGSGLAARRWLHADERGSVVAVTDDSGNAIAINKYDEYGIPAAGNLGRFQYTGQKWLPTLGLYDYKARIYSPTLGRFMQTDPIGYADGLNWYNYAGADPVNMSDPSGLEGESVITVYSCGSDAYFSQGHCVKKVPIGNGQYTQTAVPVLCPAGYTPMGFSSQCRLIVGGGGSSGSSSGSLPSKGEVEKAAAIFAQKACSAIIDADGDPLQAAQDQTAKAIGVGIAGIVGERAGKLLEKGLQRGGNAVGRMVGDASDVVGATRSGALAGERLGARLGVYGALAGAVAGVYFAPEIAQFKDKLKERICGAK